MQVLTYELLGLRLQVLTPDDILGITLQAIKGSKRYIIANHNLHSLYIYHHDLKTKNFFDRADYIHIDGMGIVALGRILGIPLRRKHRATYIDLLPHIFAAAIREGWRIFYLGSKQGVAESAAMKLREKYPGLQMRARHGHFDAEKSSPENDQVMAEIKAYEPHILMVGMGMPRQERWLTDNWGSLACNAAFCCGAALDYVAGEIPTPPRWIGQLGFEWLYRLICEPRRLWRRYLVEPWFVLTIMSQHYLRGTRQ
jgi:N-acetylglucosaminyldiphosphoundecaprenol N-acetyl-beta-D-mannosaminyltransferase